MPEASVPVPNIDTNESKLAKRLRLISSGLVFEAAVASLVYAGLVLCDDKAAEVTSVVVSICIVAFNIYFFSLGWPKLVACFMGATDLDATIDRALNRKLGLEGSQTINDRFGTQDLTIKNRFDTINDRFDTQDLTIKKRFDTINDRFGTQDLTISEHFGSQ
jgi:hypothetical protein